MAFSPTHPFFQTTSIDPALRSALPAGSPPTPSKHARPSTGSEERPKMHHNPTVKVTIQAFGRAWSIPKTLADLHSTYLRTAYEHTSTTSLTVPAVSPWAFQDFVDYIHSSIYSINKRAPDYHIIHTHLQAWVLGQTLGAASYQTAALRELHTWLEPLARDVNSSAETSPIRVQDIEYACRHTPPGSVLRAVLFDAVAAHWTRLEIINISDLLDALPLPPVLEPSKVAGWIRLYTAYPDFGKRLASSLEVGDRSRPSLLRPLSDYSAGTTGWMEEFVHENHVDSLHGSIGRSELLMRRKRADSGGYVRSPSRRRRASSSSEGSLSSRASVERQIGEEDFMMADEA